MMQLRSLVLIAYVSCMVFVDAIALLVPGIGAFAMLMHGMGIGMLCLYALFQLASIARSSFDSKSCFTLLALGIWVFFIGFWAQDSRSLSGEATQQTTCAVNYLLNHQDRGWHQTCMFGYPARQYLPQAFFSVVFGRSLESLSWGGSLYFLIGIIIFAAATFSVLGHTKRADIFTAILLSSLFHFKFVNHALFHFEQSVFPLSFALISTGLGISILLQHKYALFGLAGMTVLLIAHSYPPALVLLILLMVLAMGTSLKFPKVLPISLWLVAISVLSVILSFTYRNDVFQNNPSQVNLLQAVKDLSAGGSHLLFNTHGESYFSPIIQGVAIVILFSMLFAMHGYKTAIVAAWSYSVIALSILTKGYTDYAVDFKLHRSIVIIPPLLASVVYVMKPRLHKLPAKYLHILFAIILSAGAIYSFQMISKRPVNTHFELIKQLKYFAKDQHQSLVVSQKAALTDNVVSLHDTAQYFLPYLSVRNLTSQEIGYDNCAQVANNANFLLMLANDSACLRSLSNGQAFKISSPNLQESYVVWQPTR